MVIFHEARRFELTVEKHGEEWVARLYECVPGRLFPTLHMLRAFATRPQAIEALRRKWRVLFPEEAPLVWREPPTLRPQQTPRRRRSSGGGRR
jgi:hypothetical protein